FSSSGAVSIGFPVLVCSCVVFRWVVVVCCSCGSPVVRPFRSRKGERPPGCPGGLSERFCRIGRCCLTRTLLRPTGNAIALRLGAIGERHGRGHGCVMALGCRRGHGPPEAAVRVDARCREALEIGVRYCCHEWSPCEGSVGSRPDARRGAGKHRTTRGPISSTD